MAGSGGGGGGGGIDRRRLLIGGGVGVGLIVAWGLWPRAFPSTLVATNGESVFGAWLKIGTDGRVTVAVPQAEHGQGVYTTLPQIVADELGADWRTVAVEPAPLSPLYGNAIGLHDLFEGLFDALPASLRATAPMLTAGSSSVRQFEEPLRIAGATARALLCMAAARRWGVDWTTCVAREGFVVSGKRRARFADLAAAAVGETPPEHPPVGLAGAGKLMGKSVPRLDVPAKVDGSAQFTGDIRLADMVHAAIRQGPIGDSRLLQVDRAAADHVRGLLQIVENPRWVAAIATTGWAAQNALDALAPRFATTGARIDDRSIDASLSAALARPGKRIAGSGDVTPVLRGAGLTEVGFHVAAGVHAAIETRSATAQYREGRLELWLPTQSPGVARAAAARAAGLSEDAVVVHPLLIGGGFGQALEHDAAEQAAMLAVALRRPVSLVWSRGEDCLHDRYRPPVRARLTARLAANGAILGWRSAIAAPATGAELARRMMPGLRTDTAVKLAGDPYAVAGALPPYRLPAVAIDHHVAGIGMPTGHLRGGAHGYTAFFTECFVDELAHVTGAEPLSYRIGMLGGDIRLARCLSTAASLGSWNGGIAGSGQGIACHAFRGSAIAVLAEARVGEGGRIVVERLVAAVDCGRQINPDIVLQQIEGGLLFGVAQALGCATGFAANMATTRGFDTLDLPRLADTPDIIVEMIRSDEAPGGVSELAVPPVAPAIANALHAATGVRPRSLPLRVGT